MSQQRVKINKLPTGAPGLDDILGGGLPEFSFNILAGAPGSGKTTLAHQLIFANATPERPALYFTVLGEPALKMLRYQQQYTFFDIEKLNSAVHFINLSRILFEQGLPGVLKEISSQTEATNAGMVVVDSFRSVLRSAQGDKSEDEVQAFVQQLAVFLASSEATTFLIGEYTEAEMRDNPAFTVADGLFWLYQHVERNSVVRKLQVMKLRGQMSVPGIHTFRITDAGLQAFSRTLGLAGKKQRNFSGKRLSTGIAALDEMMGGGIPEGDSLLIAGSSGTGKSLLATQFIAAGIRAREPGIVVIFEQRAEDYARRAAVFGLDLTTPLEDGSLEVIYLRPLDLSVDEMMQEILDRGKASGDRLARPLRTGAGAGISYRLPRVALQDDPGVDAHRHHHSEHPRGRRGVHGAALQHLLHLISHRRHHPYALRRNRRPAADDHDRHKDVRRRA